MIHFSDETLHSEGHSKITVPQTSARSGSYLHAEVVSHTRIVPMAHLQLQEGDSLPPYLALAPPRVICLHVGAVAAFGAEHLKALNN